MNPRKLLPSMSLLIAFEASARHLSFTRAAEELSVTQGAVSRQVQALETLLGVSLFRRVGRQIVLTDIGHVYVRELTAALGRIRNASLQVISLQTGSGSLHLAVLPTFGSKWLLPKLNGFYTRNPGIMIHIHSRIGQFDLELAGMDAAIGVGDGNWPGMVSYPLLEEELIPVISPSLARKTPVTNAKDMKKHLLLQVASRATTWRDWFGKQGLDSGDIRLGPQFELTEHLLQAVVAGIGVGLVPRFLVEEELRNGSLKVALPCPFVTGYNYYLLIPAHKLHLPPVVAFREWLLAMSKHQQKAAPATPEGGD